MRAAFGDFVFDSDRRLLTRAGVRVPVHRKAFDLLTVLLEHSPNAVDKQTLYDTLWPETFVGPSSLDAAVSRLRVILGDRDRKPPWLRTVYGYGYAFDCPEGGEKRALSSCARLVQLRDATTHVLREGENILGRGDDVTTPIPSTKISRQHARVVLTATEATLEDLTSKNGTFLNGERISGPVQLSDGDDIALGSVHLTFHRTPEEPTATESRHHGPD